MPQKLCHFYTYDTHFHAFEWIYLHFKTIFYCTTYLTTIINVVYYFAVIALTPSKRWKFQMSCLFYILNLSFNDLLFDIIIMLWQLLLLTYTNFFDVK